MHIVVCIKQVPDSAQIRVHPVTNTIMRQGVPTIINPYDLFALEEALRLRDKFGGEVTVLTMGPPMAEDTLRKALTYRRRPRRAADRPLLRRLRHAGHHLRARRGDPQDRRDLWRAGHRLHRQADDRRRHRAGRPRHRQAARPAAAHLCRRHRRASIPTARSITVERRAEGGVQVLQDQAAVPDHHARRHQRDPPRHASTTRCAPRAPRSSPGAPRTPASRTCRNAACAARRPSSSGCSPRRRAPKRRQLDRTPAQDAGRMRRGADRDDFQAGSRRSKPT